MLGYGVMRMPFLPDSKDRHVDVAKAEALIDYAYEHGVNYFDSAYSYHGEESETILGEALDGGLRETVWIATKQPLGVMKKEGDIRRNCENTLKKLRTDYIDMYLVHGIGAGSWEEIKRREIFGEFEKLKAEGLIRHIGFSYHGSFGVFKDVLTRYPWEMCQVQQNMLDINREVTADGLSFAGKVGAAVVIMEPLRGGGLAQAPSPVKAVYGEYSKERSPAEWAFRHLLDHPAVSTILSGMTTLEQLKKNIEIFSQTDTDPGCLTDAERDIIAKARGAYESIVTIPCTGCAYCMPCPQGVNIPDVFDKYNTGHRFEFFDSVKRSYMFSTRGKSDASHCVECGLCEPKCPQGIEIRKELKKAHEVLKGWSE